MLTRGPKKTMILVIAILYLLAIANLFTLLQIIRDNYEINEKIEIISTYYKCECDCEYCDCQNNQE